MKKCLAWMILSLLLISISLAKETSLVDYHNYKNMTDFLKELADKYPSLVKLETQGETAGKRQIWSVTISANNYNEHPAVLFVGGVEGVDLVASEICLQFIQTLATHYGKVDSLTQLLANTTFYIFPRINPDAAEAFFMTPKYERRLNARTMDLDRDGEIDEDGFEDLNNDGYITQMRITDPLGEWLPDEKNPMLLRKADAAKGERGVFRLSTEGRDNDGDGLWNEDEPGGVDINRNFSYNYHFFEKSTGNFQISEAESRAVTNFAFDHPNIAVVFCFSPNENLLNPWKVSPVKAEADRIDESRSRLNEPIQSVLPEDAPYFQHIADKFKQKTQLTESSRTEKGSGAFSEWAYFHFCRWSFSVPAWWAPIVKDQPDSTQKKQEQTTNAITKKRANDKSTKADPLQQERNVWNWLQASGQSSAFISWQEISHPDFPHQKVEVGGFKPYVAINPPADSLTYRAQKYNDFLKHLGSLLPRIKILNVKTEGLENQAYRIRMIVVNEGYLPTNTHIGIRSKWNPKVKVTLDLASSQKLISGKSLMLIDRIEGNSSSEELTWLLLTDKGTNVTITAGSPMAGTDRVTVELK